MGFRVAKHLLRIASQFFATKFNYNRLENFTLKTLQKELVGEGMEGNTTNMKFAACEQLATLRKSCITHKPKAK